MAHFLGPPVVEEMESTHNVEYRLDYQQYRLGKARGAEGECPRPASGISYYAVSALPEDEFDEDERPHVSVSESAERAFNELLEWRLAYRAHRSGAAKGSRGEATKSIALSTLKLLPVARLAAHLRAQRRVQARKKQQQQSPLKKVSRRPSVEGDASEEEVPVAPVHVHVGCGRLGLGLVVPALARGREKTGGALVFVQRPSKAWADGDGVPFRDGSVCAFTINGALVLEATVVSGEGAAATAAKVRALLTAAAAAEGQTTTPLPALLVLSDAAAVLDVVAAVTTSVSCSLGPALAPGLEPLVAALDRLSTSPPLSHRGTGPRRQRLRLYAAENDHDAVEKYAEDPRIARLMRVTPLLVDRVCTDRTLKETSEGYVVDTAAEPWCGEIVVMTSDGSEDKNKEAASADAEAQAEAEASSSDEDEGEGADDDGSPGARRSKWIATVPFAGEGFFEPTSAAEAQFLHRRKILTVNGTHTTLAFLTLSTREPPPHRGLPKGSYELVRCLPAPDGSQEEAEHDIEETMRQTWCFAIARQLLLLFESDIEVARGALNCGEGAQADAKLADALLANAEAAIHRLGHGGDSTARVLGAGVVKRYEGRLLPVANFLDTASASNPSWLATPLAKLILRKAKISVTALRLTVLGLTTDAARFTHKAK